MLWLLLAFVALSFAVALILGPLMSLNSRCDDVSANREPHAPDSGRVPFHSAGS